MTHKVKWGVLGVANIAVKKVIPAMQLGQWSEIAAIASRDPRKAQSAAQQLNIPRSYGSYDELLSDNDIEAIYNPLPNNLHVEWTIKAAQAGKHVLVEKPISMTVDQALPLLRIRDETGVKIEEAFMVLTNPQWVSTLKTIKEGRIGEVRSVVGYFSYNNQDPGNIRNIRETGGGGLMDIGCYMIYFSRLIFGEEPRRVLGLLERDAETRTDILTSAILDFPMGQSIFTCSTQLVPYQRVQILGTQGRIEVEVPVNAPPDRPLRILVDTGEDLFGGGVEVIEAELCDQYTIQGDLFSKSIRENTEQPIPLESSVATMSVIEAVFRSAESDKWERP